MKKNVGNKLSCEPFYLSPLAFAGEKYGPKDDIWALGVLIIEMASLYRKPKYDSYYSFGEPLMAAEQVASGEHLRMIAHLSFEVQNLLDAMLQVDEEKRPTIQHILHFSGVIDEVNKIKESPEFRQQFTVAVKHRSIDDYFERIAYRGITFVKRELKNNLRTMQFRGE